MTGQASIAVEQEELRAAEGRGERERGAGGRRDVGGAGGASGVIQSERGGQGVTCERKRRARGRLVAGAASGRRVTSGGDEWRFLAVT